MRVGSRSFAAATILSVLLLLPRGSGSQEPLSGSISGRVTDCIGQRLASAEVALTGAAGRKPAIAVTDDAGHYQFSGLSAGSYALEIRMRGYKNFRDTDFQLPPGKGLDFDVSLALDPESDSFISAPAQPWDLDLPTLWRSVDAVVYLRIQKTVGMRRTPQTSAKCENIYWEHQAAVLEVFRRRLGGPKDATLKFLQAASAPGYAGMTTRTWGDPAYASGGEFVAFLQWDVSEEAFLAYFVLAIREGKVQSHHIPEIESGMTLEAFLKKLRAMME
jgi:hypothetical protein